MQDAIHEPMGVIGPSKRLVYDLSEIEHGKGDQKRQGKVQMFGRCCLFRIHLLANSLIELTSGFCDFLCHGLQVMLVRLLLSTRKMALAADGSWTHLHIALLQTSSSPPARNLESPSTAGMTNRQDSSAEMCKVKMRPLFRTLTGDKSPKLTTL